MTFLVFQHVEHETPGYIQQWARERGVELDVVEFWKPYRIPSLADYNGLLIMGGPMGVNDSRQLYPSRDDELAAIEAGIGTISILGICLGSQLLAHAFGGRVGRNLVDGRHVKEIGYSDVVMTADGQREPLLRGFASPIKVLQWHGDAFELPPGASLLATSPSCRNQAFRYGLACGLLFHFEFTPEMVARQIEIDRAWIHDGFELDEKALLREAHERADLMRAQCYQLMDNFFSLVRE